MSRSSSRRTGPARIAMRRPCLVLAFVLAAACAREDAAGPLPDPGDGIYRIPVVVHVVHLGEPLGQGHNLSDERITGQIRILNEDYRRKAGTPGFNTHPDGGDARIEFVLARSDPSGAATSGIVRVAASTTMNPTNSGSLFDYYAYYSYWNPDRYLNIWTLPLAEHTVDVVLGLATGPQTDLPGADLLAPGEPHQAEGILINSAHFGESPASSEYTLGRTLTHEVGHYLGLLHTWGGRDCEANDYCDDTPAVAAVVAGCPGVPPLGCDGQPIMLENYMNYTFDRCMNVFTNDQIARMHHVLTHSPRRQSLLDSPGLRDP